MARLLWIGDGGSTTGFGRVTHSLGERLVSDYGHDVHVLATNYRGDYWPTNLKLYVPTMIQPMDVYGQSRFLELLGKVDPDVVVILNDPAVILKFLYRNNWDPQKQLLQYRPLLTYVPVDGINQPPLWGHLAKVTDTVIMAEWGRQLYPDATLAYHGIDTQLFRPVSERPVTTSGGMLVRSKADAKRAFGWEPDEFLVLRVDRNSRRKDFASTWKALVPFLRRHKNAHVHFHCKARGDDGFELAELFSRSPETAERFATPANFNTRIGWTDNDLVALYNAADVFISTSYAEGFGLCLGEAIACGVPVIAQNCSAIPEVVGPGGILVEPKSLIAVQSGQDQWLPDIDAFTDALERLYQSKGARRDLGAAGTAHARSFSWDDAARTFDRRITHLLKGAVSPAETPDHAPEPVGVA